MIRVLPNGDRVELIRSIYQTWIVRVNGARRFESTNHTKAVGVFEYLTQP